MNTLPAADEDQATTACEEAHAGKVSPPELAVLLACITQPPTSPSDWATLTSRHGAIDWQRLVALAVHHRVTPLVQAAFSHALAAPAAARDRVAGEGRRAAIYALQLGRAALEVQRALDAEGLPNLIVKGSPLAVLAFGQVGLKDSRDVDLWVGSGDVVQACEVLGRLGYRLEEPAGLDQAAFERYTAYSKEASLRHEITGMTVDLHWRLVDNPHILQAVDLNSAVQWVAVGPGRVRTLADEPLFAYLCVHGAVHNWARLKWLAELNAWLSRRSASDLARLYAGAIELGAGRAARLALLLCHQLLGLRLPREVHRALSSDRMTARLAANAVAGMASTDEIGRWGVQRVRATVGPLFLGSWAFFRHQLRISTVHPGERARLRLPQRLGFLYYLLRVPLWTMARVRAATARRAA